MLGGGTQKRGDGGPTSVDTVRGLPGGLSIPRGEREEGSNASVLRSLR